MEQIRLKKISQLQQSHGDHLVLCFIAFHNLKTYCYLSIKQLLIIEKDFKIKNINEMEDLPTWKTEKKAVDEKFILNIGLLYMLNQDREWLLSNSKSRLNSFKKTPLAQLLLSDQPEIFHNHKTTYSYKNIEQFRFSDFEKMKDKSTAIKMANFSKLSELSEFLFGESNRVTNKLSLEVVLKVEDDRIEVDFNFIRFILFVRNFLNLEETIRLISNHKEIKSSKFYKNNWFSYIYSGLDKNPTGITTFFKDIKDFSNKKRLLLKWNVPSHIVENFNEVMKTAYPRLTPDLDKVSDVMYFYNNISRDYGRLFIKDFKLTEQERNFSKHIKVLDNVKTGEFTLKVPKTYHQMVEWGSTLCNCAGNFDQIEFYSKGLTVGVFKNDKIIYLIDYRDKYGRNVVNQIKGYKNCIVKTLSEMKAILNPFIENNLLHLEDVEETFKNQRDR